MCSLLRSLRNTLNEGLGRQHGTTTEVLPRCYFDYIDSDDENALAFSYEGVAFVGITLPLITRLWFACESLSKSNDVTTLLGLQTDERYDLLHAELFGTVLGFVVSHEYGHHRFGHLDDSAGRLFEEKVGGVGRGNFVGQAREIHADGMAAYFVLHSLILGDRRSACLQLQEDIASDHDADDFLLALFVLGALAFFLTRPQTGFDPSKLSTLTHPPPAVRLNYLLHTVTRWCQEKMPSLTPRVTLERFQLVLNAAQQAIWDQTCAHEWHHETVYFKSHDSAGYFECIDAALALPHGPDPLDEDEEGSD